MIKKIIAATFCIATVSLLLNIYFAGVRLVIENESNQKINNVQLNYGRGSFSAGSFESHESRKKSLGKIGEGAKFNVQWGDSSGSYQKTFTVYFSDLSGYHTVHIKIQSHGEAELHEGGHVYKGNR